VVRAKFVKAYNAIELIYDNDGGCGCKRKHHLLKHFWKLYIVSCKKNLDCEYFQKIFVNNSTDIEIDILNKQQYYVSFCHKLCEEYLNYPNPMKCPLSGCLISQYFKNAKSKIYNSFMMYINSLICIWKTTGIVHHPKLDLNVVLLWF